MPGLMPNTIAVRRLRFVGHGMHERIEAAETSSAKPLHGRLCAAWPSGNDFADLFEMKDRVRDRSAEISRTSTPPTARRSVFRYLARFVRGGNDSSKRPRPPMIASMATSSCGHLELPARGEWRLDIHVPLAPWTERDSSRSTAALARTALPLRHDSITRWLAQLSEARDRFAACDDVIQRPPSTCSRCGST